MLEKLVLALVLQNMPVRQPVRSLAGDLHKAEVVCDRCRTKRSSYRAKKLRVLRLNSLSIDHMAIRNWMALRIASAAW